MVQEALRGKASKGGRGLEEMWDPEGSLPLGQAEAKPHTFCKEELGTGLLAQVISGDKGPRMELQKRRKRDQEDRRRHVECR